jgi:subtilase family serine protease
MRRAKRLGTYVLSAAVVVAAVVVAVVAPAGASTARVRLGSTTPLPTGARVTGTTPASTPLRLTITLQPQDPSGLANYATAVSTPGSSLFRHYLTVAQFAQRYGATRGHILDVESALRTAGLEVGSVTANDLTISMTGTAAQVEHAFSVTLAQVTLPSGRVAHANQQAPALPATIAGDVQGVIGLGDVTLDQPQDIKAPHRARRAAAAIHPHAVGNGPAPCSAATATSQHFGGYTADEIAGAYGLNSDYVAGDEGAGQTVGVFEEEAYQPSDLTTFQSCYGTSASVSNVNVDGGPGAFNSSIGDDEAALDIDQVIGLAPKANILVYQGPPTATSPADILTAMVSQDRAKVLSSSWGVCEDLTDPAVISSENTTLQEAAAQGQSFFISSGDSGSTDCYQATREDNTPDISLSVIDPGGQPFATAVGGTFLGTSSRELPTDGSYPGEFVWNDGIPGGVFGDQASATGGGVSDQWQMPSYQTSASGSLRVISSNSSKSCGGQLCRQVPDVSADADPFSGYVIFANGGTATGGWEVIGGTSASAPFWAAFTALANASAACRGLTLGFVNPALYQIAGSSYAANFHDVTAADASPFSGDADNDAFEGVNPENTDGLYPLANGYDMATGLGTPIGNVLGPSLCKVRAPIFTVTVANPGAQTSTAGKPVALAIHATDSGSAPLAFTASGLPSGLTVNAANGVISGTPTSPGTFTVTVSAADQFANSNRTTFGWTVLKPVGPPALSKLSFGNIGKGKAKVSFTLTQGTGAPAIRSFSISLPKGLSFAKKTKTLSKHISLKGTKYSLKLSRGVLTITLRTPASKVAFSIGAPATLVSRSLKHKVHTHKVKSLSIGVKVLDAGGHATRLTANHKA